MKRRKVVAKKKECKQTHFLSLPKDVWLTCILERRCPARTMLHAKKVCKLLNAWLDDKYAERVLLSLHYARLAYQDDKPWMKLIALEAIERCKNSTRRIWVKNTLNRQDLLYNLGDMKNHLNWDYEQVVWHFKNGWALYCCCE